MFILRIRGRPWPSGKGRWLQNSCPLPMWIRIPTGTFNNFMWKSFPASLQNVGGFTRVSVRAWNNARKYARCLPPPIKLERCHKNFTVSAWCKSKSNKHVKDLVFKHIWCIDVFMNSFVFTYILKI
jgi:hypothetical protein